MCIFSSIKQSVMKHTKATVEKEHKTTNSWAENFDYSGFVAPFKVNADNEYFPALKAKLNAFVQELVHSGAENSLVTEIDQYTHDIIRAIELYYMGNIVDAQLLVNDLINKFDSAPAITNINNSPAFPVVRYPETEEVQFFRARLNDQVVDYPAAEMLHIPFKSREIVGSARFSISGLPCLYLGNTSYACWIEMGCPADHQFNVSPVLLDNSQKVLNLTVTFHDVLELALSENTNNQLELEKALIIQLKLLILSIATSFKITKQNRAFKSEYILSQMIMLACKHRGLDGITYYSKRVEEELFAHVVAVNVVLFASYNGEENLSEICNHIQISDSFNFAMFKQLLPCQTYKDYPLRIKASPYITNIGKRDRQFPYRETQFFEFDKYLFTNWNHTPTSK